MGLVAGLNSGVKAMGGFGGSVAGLASKLTPLGVAFSSLAGAAGMGAMIKSSFDAIDANNDMAAQLGVSQLELTGVGHAAQMSGSSADAMNVALGKLTRQGMTLDGLADQMAAIESPAEKAKLAFKVLGKSGQELIPFLSQGGKAIRGLVEEGKALKGITDIDAAKIGEANDGIDRMKAAFVGVSNTVAVALAPSLTNLGAIAVSTGQWIRTTFESLKPMFAAVGATVQATFGAALGYVQNVFGAISVNSGATFATMTDGITSAATWITSTMEGLKPTFAAVGTFVGNVWSAVGGTVTGVFNGIVAAGSLLYDGIATVFSAIGGYIGITWGGVGEGAMTTINATLGFFTNFGENIKFIFGWLGENWFNILSDIAGAVVPFLVNMTKNVGTGFNGIGRVITTFSGWTVGRFRDLFSFKVVDAILSGLIIAGTKIREWASAAWTTITSIFTGNDPGTVMKDFTDKAKSDFSKGMETVDLSSALGDIWKDTKNDLVHPLDGFKSSLTDLPKLKLDVAGVTSTLDGVKTEIKDAFTTPQMTPPDIASGNGLVDTKSEQAKSLSDLGNVEAVQRGSTAAVSAILGNIQQRRQSAENERLTMDKENAKKLDKIREYLKTIAGKKTTELVVVDDFDLL
jgi:hypothetical protein